MESGLYVGKLRHRRFSPKAHSFAYPVFMAFLDIDRLPELMRMSPFSGYNRWNWTSYCERDHFGDPKMALRERLKVDAERNGIALPDGPIFLLTHLRYFGYVFNPVSFYYCYDCEGQLQTMLAELCEHMGMRFRSARSDIFFASSKPPTFLTSSWPIWMPFLEKKSTQVWRRPRFSPVRIGTLETLVRCVHASE